MGGYFVWEPAQPGPVLLVGGAPAWFPLMAMIRHRAASGSTAEMRLLFSSRTLGRHHLPRRARAPRRQRTHRRPRIDALAARGLERLCPRVDKQMLQEVSRAPDERPLVYVCGPTPLVEAVATNLVQLGHEPARDQDRTLRTDGRLRWTR